jgi:hypothetical protein
LLLALIVDSYRVTLDSRVEHAFKLWLAEEDTFIKFYKRIRLFVYNSVSDKVNIVSRKETRVKDVSLYKPCDG